MKIVPVKKNEHDVGVPDIPEGSPWPPPCTLLIHAEATQYVVYEIGDEDQVPEHERPKVTALVGADCPDDMVLWRYIDIPKLYMLLAHGELHFTPAERLRAAEGYELRLPMKTIARAQAQIDAQLQALALDEQTAARHRQFFMPDDSQNLRIYAVSCWHINSRENNAFWSSYVPHGGVAIKTTLGRIKLAYEAHWRQNLLAHRNVLAARVEYIDYETDDFKKIPFAIGVEDVFHKAKFFEFEQEFRLVLSTMARTDEAVADHCRVPIDVATLIEEIVIGPNPKHMTDFIVKDLATRAGLDPAIVRSSRVGSQTEVDKLFPRAK